MGWCCCRCWFMWYGQRSDGEGLTALSFGGVALICFVLLVLVFVAGVVVTVSFLSCFIQTQRNLGLRSAVRPTLRRVSSPRRSCRSTTVIAMFFLLLCNKVDGALPRALVVWVHRVSFVLEVPDGNAGCMFVRSVAQDVVMNTH